MAVLASDMNGHAGSSNAGYDGIHGSFGYGDRNADGSRILEFADGLNLGHVAHKCSLPYSQLTVSSL